MPNGVPSFPLDSEDDHDLGGGTPMRTYGAGASNYQGPADFTTATAPNQAYAPQPHRADNYFQQVVNKLRIDPPAKFTGAENYEAFFKRLRSYLSMTDMNYSKLFDQIAQSPKMPVTTETLERIDAWLQQGPGVAAKMSTMLHYILSSLLEGPPYIILDGVQEGCGFEALRRLTDRYAQSKSHKAILLLVKIVSTRFADKDFECTFTTWESDILKLEEAIGLRAEWL